MIFSLDNSPTDAEKGEAHALRQTRDSNSGWLENLTRRAHEVTIAIVPAEHIGAVFLCDWLWDGLMTEKEILTIFSSSLPCQPHVIILFSSHSRFLLAQGCSSWKFERIWLLNCQCLVWMRSMKRAISGRRHIGYRQDNEKENNAAFRFLSSYSSWITLLCLVFPLKTSYKDTGLVRSRGLDVIQPLLDLRNHRWCKLSPDYIRVSGHCCLGR